VGVAVEGAMAAGAVKVAEMEPKQISMGLVRKSSILAKKTMSGLAITLHNES
jgi:hypothetical protein